MYSEEVLSSTKLLLAISMAVGKSRAVVRMRSSSMAPLKNVESELPRPIRKTVSNIEGSKGETSTDA